MLEFNVTHQFMKDLKTVKKEVLILISLMKWLV